MVTFAATTKATLLQRKVHLDLSPTPQEVKEKRVAQGPPEPSNLKYFAVQTSDVSSLVISRPTYDFIVWMPPILDQSAIGSCQANVLANMIRYKLFSDVCVGQNRMPATDEERKNIYDRMMLPARLFTYYNARLEDGEVNTAYDIGATMGGTFLAMYKHGFFDELYAPYLLENFAVRPTNLASYLGKQMATQSTFQYTEIALDEALGTEMYHLFFVSDDPIAAGEPWKDFSVIPGHMQDAYVAPLIRLLAANQPIAFGVSVQSETFFNVQMIYEGKISLPTDWVNGGHAMIMVGYDLPRRKFIVSSSWGTSVGLSAYPGYFEIGFDYICMLGFDFYVWTNYAWTNI